MSFELGAEGDEIVPVELEPKEGRGRRRSGHGGRGRGSESARDRNLGVRHEREAGGNRSTGSCAGGREATSQEIGVRRNVEGAERAMALEGRIRARASPRGGRDAEPPVHGYADAVEPGPEVRRGPRHPYRHTRSHRPFSGARPPSRKQERPRTVRRGRSLLSTSPRSLRL